jgi:hypothetical protein
MKRKHSSVGGLDKSLIRWRGNQKLERVRQIASRSGQSLNQMVNSWADMVIAQSDAEASFLAAAVRGNPERGLRLLEKLSRQDRKNRILARSLDADSAALSRIA